MKKVLLKARIGSVRLRLDWETFKLHYDNQKLYEAIVKNRCPLLNSKREKMKPIGGQHAMKVVLKQTISYSGQQAQRNRMVKTDNQSLYIIATAKSPRGKR